MTDQKCPMCGCELEPYTEIDIGVGTLQGGPWGCPACHWVEPTEDLESLLKPDEEAVPPQSEEGKHGS